MTTADPGPYSVTFLTDQWEWDAVVATDQLEEAKAAAGRALEQVVREERPEIACVTLLQGGRRIGVWDWVDGQAHWTPL